MEIVVIYILLVELQSGQILLLWFMQSLETGNTWALLEHRYGIPIQEVITLVSFERICTTTMSHGSWFLGSSGLGRLCRLGVSDWNPPGKADLVILGGACVSVLWVASELDKNNLVVLGLSAWFRVWLWVTGSFSRGIDSGQARMECGSGYLLSGNYYWTQVEFDWRSVEHRRGSLMLCGYSASPEEEENG